MEKEYKFVDEIKSRVGPLSKKKRCARSVGRKVVQFRGTKGVFHK